MAENRELEEAQLRQACGAGRLSAQRLAIARAARHLTGAFTVEQLHAATTQDAAGPGIATVYRAVAAMAACGTLAVIGERDGRTLYVWCANDEHHHHVVCTVCGAVAGVDCPLPETEALDAARNAGFTVMRHELTLFGLCKDCAEGGER